MKKIPTLFVRDPLPVSRVEIDAGGRRVVIEHEGELEPLRRTAPELRESTAAGPDRLGPAVGFQQTQGRPTLPVQPSAMWRAPRPYPVQAGGAA